MQKFINDDKFRDKFDQVVHFTIFVSFFVFALETVKELEPYDLYFEIVESISLLIFLFEYIYRILIAHQEKRLKKYLFSFIGLVDLVSIFPSFIPLTSLDLRFVKVFRLFSLFRIFKLYRYSEHLQAIIKVVENKKSDLFATLFSIMIVLVFCSCMAYYFEKDAQPDRFSNLFQAMYWGVSTLATIGYGDIYPVTIGGKLTATFLAMLGIGLITIPSAILSAGFIEEIQNRRSKKITFTAPTVNDIKQGEPNPGARRIETPQTVDLSTEEANEEQPFL